mgnify:CR=1 FL=1
MALRLPRREQETGIQNHEKVFTNTTLFINKEFLAAKSSSRSWFLVSDSNAGLNCNVMSIRMIGFDHSIFPELVTQSNLTLKCNVLQCDLCVCVPKTEYYQG